MLALICGRRPHRVFRHEGALVEQFHVHVNVVDAIVGTGILM